MEYYREDNRKRNWWAAGASVLYLLLWLALALLIRFNIPEQQQGEGILINFGDTEEASGAEDPSINDPLAAVAPAATGQEEILTQNHEDAPVVRQTQRPRTQTPAQQTGQRPATQSQTTPNEPPREVNRQALFPGRNAAGSSSSEGTGQRVGNQGDPGGATDGSHDGTGTGSSGVSFSLEGRQPVGSLLKPDYGGNERGRYVVKIQITVNPKGEVTSASYIAAGSTTNQREFRDAALIVARKAKFTPSDGDNLQQGVITYIFSIR